MVCKQRISLLRADDSLNGVPEAEAVLVKNEKYWNAEAVTLDKATFVVMPDSNAQLNAFRTGDIDIALNVPTETAGNAEFTDCLAKPLKYVSSLFSFGKQRNRKTLCRR